MAGSGSGHGVRLVVLERGTDPTASLGLALVDGRHRQRQNTEPDHSAAPSRSASPAPPAAAAGADGILVSRVIPGSPAAAGGIEPGDEVLAIDGAPVRGQAVAEVVALLRAKAGAVELAVLAAAARDALHHGIPPLATTASAATATPAAATTPNELQTALKDRNGQLRAVRAEVKQLHHGLNALLEGSVSRESPAHLEARLLKEQVTQAELRLKLSAVEAESTVLQAKFKRVITDVASLRLENARLARDASGVEARALALGAENDALHAQLARAEEAQPQPTPPLPPPPPQPAIASRAALMPDAQQQAEAEVGGLRRELEAARARVRQADVEGLRAQERQARLEQGLQKMRAELANERSAAASSAEQRVSTGEGENAHGNSSSRGAAAQLRLDAALRELRARSKTVAELRIQVAEGQQERAELTAAREEETQRLRAQLSDVQGRAVALGAEKEAAAFRCDQLLLDQQGLRETVALKEALLADHKSHAESLAAMMAEQQQQLLGRERELAELQAANSALTTAAAAMNQSTAVLGRGHGMDGSRATSRLLDQSVEQGRSIDRLEQSLDQSNADLRLSAHRLDQAKEDLHASVATIEALSGKVSALSGEGQATGRRLDVALTELDTKRAALRELEARLHEQSLAMNAQAQQLQRLRQTAGELEVARARLEAAERQVAAAGGRCADLEAQLRDADAESARLRDRLAADGHRVHGRQRQADALVAACRAVAEQLLLAASSGAAGGAGELGPGMPPGGGEWSPQGLLEEAAEACASELQRLRQCSQAAERELGDAAELGRRHDLRVEALDEQLQAARAEAAEWHDRAVKLERQAALRVSQLEVQNNQVVLQAQRDRVRHQASEAAEGQLKDDARRLQGELAAVRRDRDALQDELNGTLADTSALRADLESLWGVKHGEDTALRRTLGDLRTERDLLRSQLRVLQKERVEEHEQLSQSLSNTAGLKAIIQRMGAEEARRTEEVEVLRGQLSRANESVQEHFQLSRSLLAAAPQAAPTPVAAPDPDPGPLSDETDLKAYVAELRRDMGKLQAQMLARSRGTGANAGTGCSDAVESGSAPASPAPVLRFSESQFVATSSPGRPGPGRPPRAPAHRTADVLLDAKRTVRRLQSRYPPAGGMVI